LRLKRFRLPPDSSRPKDMKAGEGWSLSRTEYVAEMFDKELTARERASSRLELSVSHRRSASVTYRFAQRQKRA